MDDSRNLKVESLLSLHDKYQKDCEPSFEIQSEISQFVSIKSIQSHIYNLGLLKLGKNGCSIK